MGPSGANQLPSFEKPIIWRDLKIDIWLNHLKEFNTPLWKSAFKSEQGPGKLSKGFGLSRRWRDVTGLTQPSWAAPGWAGLVLPEWPGWRMAQLSFLPLLGHAAGTIPTR